MDAAAMSDDLAEDGLLSSFSIQHAAAFFATLDTFLNAYDPATTTDGADLKLVNFMGAILDVYLPAPPLLDPYLARMIPPLLSAMHALLQSALDIYPRKATTDEISSDLQSESCSKPWETGRLERMGTLLWWILKVRSWKSCLTHFPPSIPHLPLLLTLLYPTPHPKLLPPSSWATRYVLLAHLSLVALVPFDLDAVGGQGTREKVWEVGHAALKDGRGKEVEAGAILVANLMARPDCVHLLPEFLYSDIASLHLLLTLSNFIPSCTTTQLDLLQTYLTSLPPSNTSTEKSALVRKLRIKVAGRLGVRALKLQGRRERGGRRAMGFGGGMNETREGQEEGDVGDDVEGVIESLLEGLEDKDTIVRWSSAKYLARLSAMLPPSFALQLSSAVIDLFSRDLLVEDGGRVDLSAVKEGAWHGCCLAIAELARRGVLEVEVLADVVPLLVHATTFDPYTITHSTGSAVRDAAFYALWSLSRCFTKDQIRPWATTLACACVGASCCDREVGIRRSGSAAFQEGVGRLGVYPEGIDVLSKTDFYSIGVRRAAFLSAAPKVAQHEVYRTYLLDRYRTSVLRHWDKEIRVLAAQALRAIVELDLEAFGPALGDQLREDLGKTLDGTWTHGLLLVLGQLAQAWQASTSPMADSERTKILQVITTLRPQLFTSFSADQHLSAICTIISHSLSASALDSAEIDGVWRNVVALGLKTRDQTVWEGVAEVWREFNTFNATLKQALAKVLGGFTYDHSAGCNVVLARLLGLVEVSSKTFASDVETRRNSFQAICKIIGDPTNRHPSRNLSRDLLTRVFEALSKGLDDYTSDQRGDVGSWIRVACIQGSSTVVASILRQPQPEEWLTVDQYREVLGKVLKLAAERIDGVRRAAGDALREIIILDGPQRKEWQLPGASELNSLVAERPDGVRWTDASSVIPQLVQLMAYQPYRRPILEGLSLSIGSLSEGTSKPASSAFLRYISTLPASALSPSEASLLSVSRALVDIAESNQTLNRIFIPVLDTLVLLFEDSDLTRLAGTSSGKTAVRSIFSTATKDLVRIRNVQRVRASMKIITGMLAIPACAADAIKHLPTLLNHRFPTIRSTTAEQLYLVLQTLESEASEELEETLLSTSWSADDVSAETKTVCRLLREQLSTA